MPGFPEALLPSMSVAGKVQGEDGDELGAKIPMGQERKRCKMPSEYSATREDSRRLVKALSVCLSCLKSYPSKIPSRCEQGCGGEGKSEMWGTEEYPIKNIKEIGGSFRSRERQKVTEAGFGSSEMGKH